MTTKAVALDRFEYAGVERKPGDKFTTETAEDFTLLAEYGKVRAATSADKPEKAAAPYKRRDMKAEGDLI